MRRHLCRARRNTGRRPVRSAHGELIRFIKSLGYEVFEIAEMCGFLDCRNYLCIPPQLKHSFAPHRNAILEGYRPLFP